MEIESARTTWGGKERESERDARGAVKEDGR